MAKTDKKKPKDKGPKASKKKSKKVKEAAAEVPAPHVSPLAPDGFPDLPPVAGVRFATASAAIKAPGRNDVMLAELAPGTVLAGVFTRSSTRSGPVRDCEAKLAALDGPGEGLAIVVNSGNANAFTGKAGDGTVEAVCAAAGAALGIDPARVFTSSTGVIGERLPPEKITGVLGGMAKSLSPDAAEAAARAIMTTDTFPKGAMARGKVGGQAVTIIGIAKGSGMIAPDMATMLGYIFTDCAMTQAAAQALLGGSNRRSFNCITVDSDTSTSDTVLLAATGQAGNPPIEAARSADGRAFAALLDQVMKDLALQIVRDGEGATKLVEVQVTGARNVRDADRVGRSIANSPLVKTAIAGEDPNWGRIVMAIGKSGATADRDRIAIRFGDILVAEEGWQSENYSEAKAAKYMQGSEITIAVDLGLGNGAATIWTCDLTHAYISINADYRS